MWGGGERPSTWFPDECLCPSARAFGRSGQGKQHRGLERVIEARYRALGAGGDRRSDKSLNELLDFPDSLGELQCPRKVLKLPIGPRYFWEICFHDACKNLTDARIHQDIASNLQFRDQNQ